MMFRSINLFGADCFFLLLFFYYKNQEPKFANTYLCL